MGTRRDDQILQGLSKLENLDCHNVAYVELGYPIIVSLDLSGILETQNSCMLKLVLTHSDVELTIEQSDGVPNLSGLVDLLKDKLKKDLALGIAGLVTNVRQFWMRHTDKLPDTHVTHVKTESNAGLSGKGISPNPSWNSHKRTFSDAEISAKGGSLVPSGNSSKRSRSDDGPMPWEIYWVYSSIFNEIRRLGKGGYGAVFESMNHVDSETYAVKKIPFNVQNRNIICSEARMMAKAAHPSFIQYYQSWTEEGVEVSTTPDEELSQPLSPEKTHTLFIVMELCPRTLEDRMLMEQSPLHPDMIRKFALQMLEGIQYLHHKGIVHRDLSRQNVLVDSEDNIKIADMGLAVQLDDEGLRVKVSKSEGNPLYQAPEVKFAEGNTLVAIDEKVDIFAIGLILYELIHNVTTVSQRDHVFGKFRIGKYDWKHGEANSVKKYLGYFLSVNPSARSSAQEILEIEMPFGS